MDHAARDEYLASIDPAWWPMVTELDAAVMASGVPLDSKVRYRMLSYAIGQHWHWWVCAIDAAGKVLRLRFLLGSSMSDPKGVLRPGTSTLSTWDIGPDEAIDANAVGAYVREAAAAYQARVAAEMPARPLRR
jgi:hypothetical protein